MVTPLRVDAVDLSHYQSGHLSFPTAKKAGVKGVWHKATESTTVVDALHNRRRGEVSAAGMPFGSYHFARPAKSNGTAQARRFLHVAGWRKGDLRPMLDLEDRGGLSRVRLTAWVGDFVKVIRDETGVVPFIYTPFDLDDSFGCPLWVARYSNANAAPRVPAPWRGATMRQFSDGRYGRPSSVAGIGHVDLNHLAVGSIADHVTGKPPPKPAQPVPMHSFSTPMPVKRPHIGHADPSWKGDQPSIFTTSRDVYRDLNWRWVWNDPKHRDQAHGGTARNLHWPTAQQNNYHHLLLADGRTRPLTKAELARPLSQWRDADVARWRRTADPHSARPYTYLEMARYARARGRVICAELKSAEFATAWIAAQLVASAKRAGHPPWFTVLYHGHAAWLPGAVRSVLAAGGDLAVIFGRFQHERAAYAYAVRRWPVRPSATW